MIFEYRIGFGAHGYDEWGLESTNFAIFLKATLLL